MKYRFTALLILFSLLLHAQLKRPADVLPEYGQNVSYYHQVEGYFAYLVQNSTYIQHQPYGQTSEGRGLNAYYISTPENLKNLEAIREGHLNSIGLGSTSIAPANKIIVWLSFNVHGNEPAGAESAMNVAYNLLNPDNKEAKDWLKDAVIILDPCINPDGYSRYGNWLHTVSGKQLHADPADREHAEPWPRGRENHYLFDLNRDWAWQVQPETQQRMELYNKWMPMIHADVHEMEYSSPYFFPPPAEPMHDFITQGQKDFYEAIGQMESKKFDKNGWGYYTREVFDLFYPSYGDTYPCFNGAVGMTFEQGGIGAGRAVKLSNGKTLTLKDRIDHHTAAMLTVVETAVWKKDMLTRNFRAYFKDSRENPKGKYQTYVVKNSGKTQQLATLLSRNKIKFAYADESKKSEGYSYYTDKEEDFTIQPNDLIISADQPKAVLTQILFEPVQRLSDSLSYDITSWDLPHAYGIESYALKRDLKIKTRSEVKYKGKFENEGLYAFYIPWNGRASVKILGLLHQNKIRVRSAHKNTMFRGVKVSLGDLVVLKSDNPQLIDFQQSMSVLLDGKPDYEIIESGYSLNGGDLGGDSFPLLAEQKVLLVSGNGVSSTDFGQAWFYMDSTISYPYTVVDVKSLGHTKLEDYTTLVLADGNYTFSDSEKARLDSFVTAGGKVIAIGGALSVFEDRAGYNLTRFSNETAKGNEEKIDDAAEEGAVYSSYDSAVRQELSGSVSGAIVENALDKTHPLSFGLGEKYFSLKTDASHYQVLKGASNAIYVPKHFKSWGFIGSNLKKKLANTVTFAVDYKGRGQVVYMVDNPLFRGFWENGNLLFANALFQVN